MVEKTATDEVAGAAVVLRTAVLETAVDKAVGVTPLTVAVDSVETTVTVGGGSAPPRRNRDPPHCFSSAHSLVIRAAM